MTWLKTFTLLLLLNFVASSQVMMVKDLKLDSRKRESPAIIDRDVTGRAAAKPVHTSLSIQKSAVVNFIKIDSMTNIFGMWGSRVTPFDYNSDLNLFTFVHRSDRTSYATDDTAAGQIFYNYSTDGGLTWPRIGPVNGLDPIEPFGRYPGGSIFAPTANLEDTRMFCAYPNIWCDEEYYWGDVGLGGDSPITTGNIWSMRISHDSAHVFSLGKALPTWTTSQAMFAATEISDNYFYINYLGTRIFRSSGGAWTDPPLDPVPYDTNHVLRCLQMFGGDAIKVGDVEKIVFAGLFDQYVYKNITYPESSTVRYTIVPIYSTDQGLTWTADPDTIKFDEIPGLGDYRTPWMTFGSEYDPEGDIALDSLGYPHIVIGMQEEGYQRQGIHTVIAEIYKDVSGWKGKIVTPCNSSSDYILGGSSGGHQTTYHPQIARNTEGTFFGLQYLNSKDATKNVDIFVTGRYWKADLWKEPINITQTRYYSENAAVGCPRLIRNGDSLFTFWSAYAQVTDVNDPTASVNRTYIMAGAVQLNLTPLNFHWIYPLWLDPTRWHTITPDSCIPSIVFRTKDLFAFPVRDSFNLKFRLLNTYGNEVYVYTIPVGPAISPDSILTINFNGILCYPAPGTYTLQLIFLDVINHQSSDTLQSSITVVEPAPITRTLIFKKHSAYTELTGVTVLPLALDDSTCRFQLPFQFTYDGVVYDSAQVSTNGWIELGKGSEYATLGLTGTSRIGDLYNDNNLLAYSTRPNKVFSAWWDDLSMRPYQGATDSGEISYKVSGTEPSRVLTIQYKNIAAYFYNGTQIGFASNTRLNWQVKMYEGTNIIQFHYGPIRKGALIDYPFGVPSLGASIGLKDTLGGDYHFFDIASNGFGNRYFLNDTLNALRDWPGPDSLLEFVPSGTIINVSTSTRWSIVSCPVLRENYGGYFYKNLFPSALYPPFGFSGSYAPETLLTPGRGYWLKGSNSSSNQIITGKRLPIVTVTLRKGWNLIGGPDHAVPAPSGGIVSGSIFTYSGGYMSATTMYPARGYWVKATSAGTISIGGYEAFPKDVPSEFEKYASITITDNAGSNVTLYVTQMLKGMKLENYEMPPVPEEKVVMPDVRFASGRVLEAYPTDKTDAVEYGISMQALEYPMVVSWDATNSVRELSLIETGRTVTTTKLSGKGKVTISKAGALSLKVGEGIALPKKFALGQNYPNPFNPTTHFMVEMPKDAFVDVVVYDILGRRVATLLSGEQTAGYHLVEWDGQNSKSQAVASGMYLIRMTSERFTAIRKVLLMK
jgi:hypothetical protein